MSSGWLSRETMAVSEYTTSPRVVGLFGFGAMLRVERIAGRIAEAVSYAQTLTGKVTLVFKMPLMRSMVSAAVVSRLRLVWSEPL